MRHKQYVYIAVLLFLIVLKHSMAQEKDWRLWSDLSVDVKTHKRWRAGAEIASRFRDNGCQLQQYYLEIKSRYRCRKSWHIGVQYRYIVDDTPNVRIAHRFSSEFLYKNKWKRFEWTWRERFQYKKEIDTYELHLRSKFGLTYDIKKCKLAPFVATEHYTILKVKQIGYTVKWRWKLGMDYPINKQWDITVAWMLEQEYNTPKPLTVYALLCSLKLHLQTY